MNLTELIARRSRPMLIAIGLGLLAVMIVIQKASPPGFESHVFYLVPVSFFAWFVGRRTALVVSLFSTAAALAIQRAVFRDVPAQIAYWNAFAWLAVYVFFVRIISEVLSLYRREKTWSHTDSLTGLPNRRSFFERLEIEKSRAQRHNRPVTLAYIDIDHFKHINDTYGHSMGDEVLKVSGQVMVSGVRRGDIVARLGGDEFAVLLPETAEAAAAAALDKLRSLLNAAAGQHHWPVAFSMGAVTFQPPSVALQDMISAADKAMYAAKKAAADGLSIAPAASRL